MSSIRKATYNNTATLSFSPRPTDGSSIGTCFVVATSSRKSLEQRGVRYHVSARLSVCYVPRSGMVEWRRDAERVDGSDSAHGPKRDDGDESKLHHLEGEGREGVDQWRDQVALKDSEAEEDSESAPDVDSDDDDDDDDDSDLKTDSVSASKAIALAAKKSSESPPSFGNIVVNSSSDVHFGNKTFYNGPVTIKQFVYTTRDGSVDVHRSEADGGDDGDSQADDEASDRMPDGLVNGKVQCPVLVSETSISAPATHALTSEPSPEVNGSLLPIWQPSTSEYHHSKAGTDSVGTTNKHEEQTRACYFT